MIGIEALPRPSVPDDASSAMGDASSAMGEGGDTTPSTFCAKAQLEETRHEYCADFDESITTLWVGAAKRDGGLTPLGSVSLVAAPLDAGREVLAVAEAPPAVVPPTVRASIEPQRSEAFDIGLDSTVGELGSVVLSVTFRLRRGGDSKLSLWVKSDGVGVFTNSIVRNEAAEFQTTIGKRARVNLKREDRRLTITIDGTSAGMTTFDALPNAADVAAFTVYAGNLGSRPGVTPAAGNYETRIDNLTVD